MKIRLLFVIGTRPEIIKTAPVISLFRSDSRYKVSVCFTGQHKIMAEQMIRQMGIKVDYSLDLMQPDQSLNVLAGRSISSLASCYSKFNPDLVFVQGDTSTAFCATLAARYLGIRVAHIEAGLRSFDKYSPYPEEVNRRLISHIADYHFAPTALARANLLNEGVDKRNIVVTGNTVIDALFHILKYRKSLPACQLIGLPADKKLILVTAHRRENFGGPLKNICLVLKKITQKHKDAVIVYPVHLNPNVEKPVRKLLGRINNIRLIKPLGYIDFVQLMSKAYLILTDSGGIQEEAPSLGIPVLILRKETERPEVVTAGCAKIVGTDPGKILKAVDLLFNSRKEYLKMSRKKNPVGDGKASIRIKEFIDSHVLI